MHGQRTLLSSCEFTLWTCWAPFCPLPRVYPAYGASCKKHACEGFFAYVVRRDDLQHYQDLYNRFLKKFKRLHPSVQLPLPLLCDDHDCVPLFNLPSHINILNIRFLNCCAVERWSALRVVCYLMRCGVVLCGVALLHQHIVARFKSHPPSEIGSEIRNNETLVERTGLL